jgi:peptidoglycan pentaglycine glycine transferase (the first glycine)
MGRPQRLMEARIITDRRQWNEFVRDTPTGHLCQTYEWSEHGEDPVAREGALRVGVLDGDRLVGAVLLLRSTFGRVPGALYYAPRGPVVPDADGPVLPALMRAAAKLARQRGGFGLRVEPNMPDDDPRWAAAFTRLGFRPTDHVIYLRNTWILDIRPDEKQLLADMQTTWRYNIGKTGRSGVTVRHGVGEADLDTFYRLQTETAEREHFYLYPKAVFRDMLAHYSPEAAAREATAILTLLIAEYEGQPLAATTVATFGKWAWSMHTGVTGDAQARTLRPNYLLQWEAMRWARSQGCDFFDFRNIPEVLEPGQPMYGVYEFKKGFGGFFHRNMPTMELVLNPLIYYPYNWAVDLRHNLRSRGHKNVAAPTDEAKNEAPNKGEAAQVEATS